MRPELLAPAGDRERLQMALAYGADAVYLAGETFGMRAFAGNFDGEGLREAAALCRAAGAKLYLAANIMPRNGDVSRLPDYLALAGEIGADALIVSDIGVLSLAKRHAPGLPLHISTQASVVNWQSATAWYELGASRVILARELTIDEIIEIRQRTPAALELETFVHGAMCVSYSGRCLLSNYMTGRDANRGACAGPCRYHYALMEEKRFGEYFPIEEDKNGSYILNARDLCLIDHLPLLLEAGIRSFKIEGRAKSAYYAAIVTGAYRQAIDAALGGKALDPLWRAELEKVSHRPYSTGFLFGPPGQSLDDSRYIRDWQVLAVAERCSQDGLAVLSLRNKFAQGDLVELVGPGLRPLSFLAPQMWTEEGEVLDAPRHPEMRFQMQLPQGIIAPPLSFLRKKKTIED